MACLPLRLLTKSCHFLRRPRSVKIVTPEGGCLRFDGTAIAKEVLMEYPSHALFLLDAVRSLGCRARPLHAASRLQPRHVYFLVPQPSDGRYLSCSSLLSDSSNTLTPALASCASLRRRSTAPRTRKVTFAPSAASPALLNPACGESKEYFQSACDVTSSRESLIELLPSPAEGVLRLKMVVSKKQLARLLRDGGDRVSMVEGAMSPLLRQAQVSTACAAHSVVLGDISSWRPSLSSISEHTL